MTLRRTFFPALQRRHTLAATNQQLATPFISPATILYTPTLVPGNVNLAIPFIAPTTTLYTPTLVPASTVLPVPFIGASTTLYGLSLGVSLAVPFIASTTTLYAPAISPSGSAPLAIPYIDSTAVGYDLTLAGTGVVPLDLPYIDASAAVYDPSLFTNGTGAGPGNGGELFALALAPNGTSVSGTLATALSLTSTLVTLTGTGFPAQRFCATVDSELIYLVPTATAGVYQVLGRGLGNTATATHSIGATATWTDSYDLALVITDPIAAQFTADIDSTGSTTYKGWLLAYDSTQAYIGSSRYAMHVTSFEGVFDAGAGVGGSNRCDSAQASAVSTAAGFTDDCPAALTMPTKISTNIDVGDVAVARYTNPTVTTLTLGSRSVGVQSWYGLMRVDSSNVDVTDTDTTAPVIDGTANGEWLDPSVHGINPATGVPTLGLAPYTTATLPGATRTYTSGSPYSDTGWPVCALSVRNGSRRVPRWSSWDWSPYDYAFSGYGTDTTYCQLAVRSSAIPATTADVDGPDALWDDGSYYFGASWYVLIYSTPVLVSGPSALPTPPVGAPPQDPPVPVLPTVIFDTSHTPTVSTPSPPAPGSGGGGSGGGVGAPFSSGGSHITAAYAIA